MKKNGRDKPQLAAVYSSYLVELLDQKAAPVNAVELSPWQTWESLPKILPGLAGLDLYFHGSNLTQRLNLLISKRSRLTDTLNLIQAKWYSTHIALLPPGWVWLALRMNIYLPPPPVEWMLPGFIRDVGRLAGENPIPLLLENMPVEPGRVYRQFKTPEIYSEIIEKTGCGLLLDLPHARIAAEAFGMEATEYLKRLPLERVSEIHTSGPLRRSDGILIDRHAVMQAEDYALLEWALVHTPARLVTLEYFKDLKGLDEQLTQLSALIKKQE